MQTRQCCVCKWDAECELFPGILQMISDLNTYLNKAVPDTRLTIKKYLDAKFEYLVGTHRHICHLRVLPDSDCHHDLLPSVPVILPESERDGR